MFSPFFSQLPGNCRGGGDVKGALHFLPLPGNRGQVLGEEEGRGRCEKGLDSTPSFHGVVYRKCRMGEAKNPHFSPTTIKRNCGLGAWRKKIRECGVIMSEQKGR